MSVFVYGSLAHPDDLASLLGRPPDGADVRPATLDGYRRLWTVCTDNTDPDRRVTYYRPGATVAEPIQVLFLAVVPDDGAATPGLLVRVEPWRLAGLDRREGNYVRLDVTAAVWQSRREVVWTYVAAPLPRARAEAGIAAGTARIRREYLDRVHDGLTAHGLPAVALPDGVPVVPLDRRIRPGRSPR